MLLFESAGIRKLSPQLRVVLLISHFFCSLLYAPPTLGLTISGFLNLIQISNSAADLLAKIGVGSLIFNIAWEKTDGDLASVRRASVLQAND